MTQIKDIVAYFCHHYPNPDDLSAARLTKMVYLADWKASIQHRRQLTFIRWYFNEHGPYVPDVLEEAKRHPRLFRIEDTQNPFGHRKRIIRGIENLDLKLEQEDQAVLDHVIRTTKDLRWSDFIHLVYSTYPILASNRYSHLNLIEMAERYAEEREYIRESRERRAG